MIDRGADVNKMIDGLIEETPLIQSMNAARHDWRTASVHI